ncbi:hypothetical protein BT96DRAFT_1026234 [Gymnopus androsaceus JB14]|uniref:Uncharacterized protein n=1 Tax=Gymnopus androsaceus JB14 TaxID=1447944 RepID=A0A6A4GL31_9AGAR|nr:hypothetical protein BT96DRAFT_1026234 [Gymnopus androsaceus JB14]
MPTSTISARGITVVASTSTGGLTDAIAVISASTGGSEPAVPSVDVSVGSLGKGATSDTVPQAPPSPLTVSNTASSQTSSVLSSSTRDSVPDKNTSGHFTPTAALSSAVNTRTISSSLSTSTRSSPSSTSASTAPPKTVSAAVIGGSVAGSLIALLTIGICILFIIRRRRHVRRRLHAERRQAIPLEGDLFMSEKLRINYGQSHSSQAVGVGSHLQVIPPSAITPAESGHRTEQLEIGGSGKSQVASLQDSNTEMRTTIGRLMGRVQYLEAQLESGDSVAGMSPPTYVSS